MSVLVCVTVGKVGDATAALGRTVAPHVRRHSAKLLPASFTRPASPGGYSKFDDACDIAASGLKGSRCLLLCVSFCFHQLSTLFVRNTLTHPHPFNGPFSGTTYMSQYQKGKTSMDFTEARDSEWQWCQLGHMQVCTSLHR